MLGEHENYDAYFLDLKYAEAGDRKTTFLEIGFFETGIG